VLIRKVSASQVVWYESPLLAAAGTPHGFSTRLGGVSPAPFDSLNLGNPSGDSVQDAPQRIAENYLRLQTAIGAAGRRVLQVHQVHGRQVAVAAARGAWDPATQADAMIVTATDQLASVRVADCVPILLAAADGGAAAAVHAGWRGVVAGVVGAAVAALRKIRPDAQICAAIGPCIGFEAFEVGPEVLEAFEAIFGNGAVSQRRRDGKGRVDLRRAVALQLTAAGVAEQRIDSADLCTARDRAEFFSHRRDQGRTGRMAAIIGVRPAGQTRADL
jgi:purine-nucleoside/S-methyl-5'-thioadenosine phosphorylase / adenosine deaminase